MQQQPEASVSMDNAWRAALERAKRGTEALIVAEAQILELEGQLTQAGSEIERLKREVEQLQEQPEEEKAQCQHWEADSPCDWDVCRQKEVSHGDQGEQEQPAAAVGEAVPTHPFSD